MFFSASVRTHGHIDTKCHWNDRTWLLYSLNLESCRSQLTINTAIVYMHRFYMVQSFTRFHRNVSSVWQLWSVAAAVDRRANCRADDVPAPPPPGHRSCRTLPGRQGGGAAPQAGARHQGGPCLPQPSGSVPRRPQWRECPTVFFFVFFLTANYSFSQRVRAVHTWLVASRDPSCVPPPGPTIGTSDGSFRILHQTLWDSSDSRWRIPLHAARGFFQML